MPSGVESMVTLAICCESAYGRDEKGAYLM